MASYSRKAIFSRRDAEDRRLRLQSSIRAAATVAEVSAWEGRAENVFRRTAVKKAVRSARESAAEKLARRREELRALLAEDAVKWRGELDSLRVTPQEKKAQMIARARAYRREKEERRKAETEEARYRMWRAANDVVRGEDSRYMVEKVLKERTEQVALRKANRAKEAAEEEEWKRRFNEEQGRRDDRSSVDRQRTDRIVSETRAGLQKQLEDNAAAREAEERRKQEELEQFRQLLAEEERRKLEEAREKDARQRARTAEINACNDEMMARKRAEAEAEREQNRSIVHASTTAHDEEMEHRRQEKLRLRAETTEYRVYLERRRQAQASLDRRLEQLTQAELDRVNAKRDAVKSAEDAARAKLLCEVQDGRAAQIEADRTRLAREQRAKEEERVQLERDLARLREEQKAQEALELQAARDRQELFRTQMQDAQRRKYERKHRKPPKEHQFDSEEEIRFQARLARELAERRV